MRRMIEEKDRSEYLKMVDEFYHTDACDHVIDESHAIATFNELMRSNDYVFCYIFEENDAILGYALFSKMFSQEAGGMAYIFEEFYLRPEARGKGIGHDFFNFILEEFQDEAKRIRLEVTPSNLRAKKLYEKFNFEVLDYTQMINDNFCK